MNIAQSVERAAHWFADQPAILAEGATITYRELNADASRLANALRAHGVQRGDRVALYLPNIAAFAVCYLGALKVGAIAVSINAIASGADAALRRKSRRFMPFVTVALHGHRHDHRHGRLAPSRPEPQAPRFPLRRQPVPPRRCTAARPSCR